MELASVCAGVLIVNHYFKRSIDMFERMEIAETIYEGVIEPSHSKPIEAGSIPIFPLHSHSLLCIKKIPTL